MFKGTRIWKSQLHEWKLSLIWARLAAGRTSTKILCCVDPKGREASNKVSKASIFQISVVHLYDTNTVIIVHQNKMMNISNPLPTLHELLWLRIDTDIYFTSFLHLDYSQMLILFWLGSKWSLLWTRERLSTRRETNSEDSNLTESREST